jgi:hypothetical protein
MDDQISWLLEQVAKDEQMAQAVSGDAWDPEDDEWQDLDDRAFRHIVHWGPGRVLAECEAKRRIIGLHADAQWYDRPGCHECGVRDKPCRLLTVYGAMYANLGRPGYREDWRP